MNFGNFLYQFDQETRKRIRELEKLCKQLSKSKNAVAFSANKEKKMETSIEILFDLELPYHTCYNRNSIQH